MGFLKKPSRYAPFSDQFIFGLSAAYWGVWKPGDDSRQPESFPTLSTPGTQFGAALSPMAAFEELLSFSGSYIYNPVVVI
jgi:hypothetical protein